MPAYVFDIEGNGFNEYTIKGDTALPEVTRVHLLCMIDTKTRKVYTYREDRITEGLARLSSASAVIGHNIYAYDLPVLRRLYGWVPSGKVFDTIVAARLLWPDPRDHPHGGNSLDALSVAAGGVRKQHYTGGFEEWSPEMEAYCEDDVRANLDIFNWIKPQVKKFRTALRLEHRVADIISHQTENGVSIDVESAEKLIDFFQMEEAECRDSLDKAFPPLVYEQELPKARMYEDPETGALYEFKKSAPIDVQRRLIKGPPKTKTVTQYFNPGSTPQVADRLLKKYGWAAPRTAAGNPSVTEQTLLSLEFPEAQYLVRYNMANKRLQHLKDWVQRARECRTPGRIHPTINSQGAATSRMTHKQPNQTACPRVSANADGPIKGYQGRWGYEMRSLWKPRDGWLMVGGDASGLELRLLGWALSPYDGGDYIRALLEGDIHTTNQQAGGLDTRAQSKEAAYAFFYGSGNETLGDTIMHHQSLSPEQRRRYIGRRPDQVGAAYKRTFKQRTKGLAQLMKWCENQANKHGYMALPDGRHVPIRKAYAALNTLLQGTGGVCMKLALVLHHDALVSAGYRRDEDFAYMLNAHDEFQLECRPDIAEFVGQKIVWSIEEAGRRLKITCPLTGEYKIGSSWADTH